VWLLAALFLIYAAQLTFHLIPEPVGGLVTRWSPLVIFPAAALLCGVHGFRRGRERAAWLLLGSGLLLWGFGIAYFTILQWDLKVIPTPSPADGFWLAVYPPWYAGLILLFRARIGAVSWRVAVDGLIGALGMGAIAAAIVFEAVLHSAEGSPAAVITNLAYPVGDLLLLSLVVGVMVVGGRRMWRVDVKYVGIETIGSPVGNRRAVHMSGEAYKAKPNLALDGAKATRTFDVWVSDDADHVPLKMSAHTELGDVEMDLTEYSRP